MSAVSSRLFSKFIFVWSNVCQPFVLKTGACYCKNIFVVLSMDLKLRRCFSLYQNYDVCGVRMTLDKRLTPFSEKFLELKDVCQSRCD